MKKIKGRKFLTGAYRDEEEGKDDPEGFLSPLVIDSFNRYMTRHRLQSNGEIRDSDNWQKGFGENHLDVCMKSAWRHFLDLWKEHRGIKSRDGIDEAINGLLFNIMAYSYKLEKDKNERKT